jgi:hypothetical protein
MRPLNSQSSLSLSELLVEHETRQTGVILAHRRLPWHAGEGLHANRMPADTCDHSKSLSVAQRTVLSPSQLCNACQVAVLHCRVSLSDAMC